MHEAKQIFIKSESDGALAVCFRCCGDGTTEQWHTLYLRPETTNQEIQDFTTYAKKRTEDAHAVRERARGIIEQGV